MNEKEGKSLIAAIEGNDAGMSHADLVLTCQMLRNGRELFRKEAEDYKAQLEAVTKEREQLKGWLETETMNRVEFEALQKQHTALLSVARAAKQLLDGPQVKMSLFDALNESLHKLPESGVDLSG